MQVLYKRKRGISGKAMQKEEQKRTELPQDFSAQLTHAVPPWIMRALKYSFHETKQTGKSALFQNTTYSS